jgi:hypothetical protein
VTALPYSRYSTLPNLRRITTHEVFARDTHDAARLLAEKQEALRTQTVFCEHDNDPLFYDVCAAWIREHYPRALAATDFLGIAREVEEDLLIHRIVGDRDWVSSAHVCFPSHWLPEEKIGKSFEEVHRPVPMNLATSRKLAQAAARSGIFERFVWSVVHDDRHNFHPRLPASVFDRKEPRVLVKVERQVTVAFPAHDFCLFILRQSLIPEDKLDKPVLAGAIEAMTAEEKAYKGLDDCDDLVAYLRGTA